MRKNRCLVPAGRQQVVTGIVVKEIPNAPAEYRRRLRQELRFCRKFGVSDHMARLGIPGSEEHYLHHLLGRVNYVLQIAPEKAEFLQARSWLLQQLSCSGKDKRLSAEKLESS